MKKYIVALSLALVSVISCQKNTTENFTSITVNGYMPDTKTCIYKEVQNGYYAAWQIKDPLNVYFFNEKLTPSQIGKSIPPVTLNASSPDGSSDVFRYASFHGEYNGDLTDKSFCCYYPGLVDKPLYIKGDSSNPLYYVDDCSLPSQQSNSKFTFDPNADFLVVPLIRPGEPGYGFGAPDGKSNSEFYLNVTFKRLFAILRVDPFYSRDSDPIEFQSYSVKKSSQSESINDFLTDSFSILMNDGTVVWSGTNRSKEVYSSYKFDYNPDESNAIFFIIKPETWKSGDIVTFSFRLKKGKNYYDFIKEVTLEKDIPFVEGQSTKITVNLDKNTVYKELAK